MPVAPLHFLLLFILLVILLIILQLEILGIVLSKLGLSPGSAITLLFATLLGSAINLPLFTMHAKPSEIVEPPPLPKGFLGRPLPYYGKTVVAINVGGALIPIGFSLYLFTIKPLPYLDVLLATAIVTALSYAVSRPIKGLGIGMPILLAPITAALAAILLNPEHSPPLAYISGTLGVLIGADLLRLKDIRKLATPVAAIGGAGTFDGIFFTGIIAVLLA
jgi:uncharacterized membrane protein